MAEWHRLTTLPMSNGLAYTLCRIIVRGIMKLGENHNENTGCLNDFLWDKRGIDVCMRAAFLCEHCKEVSRENPYLNSQGFVEITHVLNAISNSSRQGKDILTDKNIVLNKENETTDHSSLIFMCHNSQDKPSVRVLNQTLKNAGVQTWLDEERIINPAVKYIS